VQVFKSEEEELLAQIRSILSSIVTLIQKDFQDSEPMLSFISDSSLNSSMAFYLKKIGIVQDLCARALHDKPKGFLTLALRFYASLMDFKGTS